MPFNPTGTLHLIGSVPLDNTYENTIDFADVNEQSGYFLGKKVFSATEGTYIRKDTKYQVPYGYEQLMGVNYVMYSNGGKWFYAFITEKEYVNDSTTRLLLETDVFQTYMFDFAWHDTYIEREHQNRWFGVNSPIYNVQDEGLTLGDEYTQEQETILAVSDRYFLVVTTDPLEDGSPAPVRVQTYPTPFYYYLVPYYAPAGFVDVQQLCVIIGAEPKIISVSYIPFLPFDINTVATASILLPGGSPINIYKLHTLFPAKMVLTNYNKFTGMSLPNTFGVGIPRQSKYESKLLCYPYSYNMLTDCQAQPMILKNEYLANDNVEISVSQVMSHDPKTKYYISNGYLGETTGKVHFLMNQTVNDLPLKTYEYYNYMLSHKSQITAGLALNAAEGAAGLAIGALTGGIGLALTGNTVMSAAKEIGMELAKQKDLQSIPQTVRHMGNNVAFDLADGNYNLKMLRYAVTQSIKESLAGYWAKYGYKSNSFKKPDLRSRYYYNYIKTIGCNISGGMDNKDLDKLKNIFNTGITIWHNRAGVNPLDYSFDNVEMNLL